MDQQDAKQQLIERLKTANNVLVTVSANPSVDQLAACIGLTLLLNKQGKHATAVFSGAVPSTLEFLQPEETLEKNTDSLRDFIISLDKSKADKLRYKVEDAVVKIFITPYRTSLSADDLEFGQGDFNVDLVVALGVKEQQELDRTITAHGRILHDATVSTINTGTDGNLGSINWHDTAASSLCELVADLGHELGKDLLDNQIATALLTGIVAETARFSNEKTTPQTMSVSAELMSNGANQQLVASNLEGSSVEVRNAPAADGAAVSDDPVPGADTAPPPAPAAAADGTLEISHPDETAAQAEEQASLPEATPADAPDADDAQGNDKPESDENHPPGSHSSRLVVEPPTLGGQLTANTEPEGYDPTTDPLSLPNPGDTPMLTHDSQPAAEPGTMPDDGTLAIPPPPPPVPVPPPPLSSVQSAPFPPATPVVPSGPPQPAEDDKKDETLADLEHEVHSPHTEAAAPGAPDIDAARSEVVNALSSVPEPNLPPLEALNAQPVNLGTQPAAGGAFQPAPGGEGEVTSGDSQPPQAAPGAPVQPASDLSFNPADFGVNEEPEIPGPSAPLDNVKFPVGKTMTMPLPPAPLAAPQPSGQPTVSDPTAPPPVPPPLPFHFGGAPGSSQK